jgi:hypothetical protein
MVHPLPKGVRELIFGNGSDDPLQAHLEAVLGQREASQLQLHCLKEKKSTVAIFSKWEAARSS